MSAWSAIREVRLELGTIGIKLSGFVVAEASVVDCAAVRGDEKRHKAILAVA